MILFLEYLRICCVLCESQKLTKITSFAGGIYSKSPHGLVPCLEYYRCSICGTVRWTRVPVSSPHSIRASQSESNNALATMADGLAWSEFVVGNARCKFAVSELLLWKKRKLLLQMNVILWKLTKRIKSGKILTLFTTSTTVKSGPVIWLLSTLFQSLIVVLAPWYFFIRSETYLIVALYKILGGFSPVNVHKSDISRSGCRHEK